MIAKRLIQVTSVTVLRFSIACCTHSFSIAILAMTSAEDSRHYNWTMQQVSWILNASPLIFTLSMIPNNYLKKVFPTEFILSSSVFTMGILYLALPYAAPYGWWCTCLLRALNGYCNSAYFVYAVNVISNWAPVDEKTRIMTLFTSGRQFGSFVGSATSGIVIEKLGWQYVCSIFGSIACFCAIFMKFVLVESPSKHSTITAEERALYKNYAPSNDKMPKKFNQPPWFVILKSPAIWAIISSTVAIELAGIFTGIQFPIYLKNVIGIDVGKVGFFISLPQSISWLSMLPISWAADYMIQRGMPIIFVRQIFNSISLWGYGAVVLLLCYTEKPIYIFCLMCIGEILLRTSACGHITNILDVSPNFVGAVKSVQGLLVSSTFLIGPLISGYILQDSKDSRGWRNSFLVGVVCLFAGNLVFLIFAKGEQQDWDCIENFEEESRTKETSE